MSTKSPDGQEQLQEQLVEEFRRDGYTVLRGIFDSKEVLAWRDECERLVNHEVVDSDNLRTPFAPASKIPQRIEPVCDLSPMFARLATDEHLSTLLRALLDDEPMLFKDKLIFKAPGTGGYEMHQDHTWWQISEPQDLIALSIHIDAADEENGCIEVFPGCHEELLSPPGEWRNLNAEETATIDLTRGRKMVMQPGDVLVLHALAPHRSADNSSSRLRRSLYFTYNAARAGVLYADYQQHLREELEQTSADSANDLFYR